MTGSSKEKELKTLSFDELREALWHFENLADRMLTRFLLFGDTARSIVDNRTLKGDKIEVGMKREWLIPEALSVLKQYSNGLEKTKKGYKMEYEGVPIYLTVYERKYDVLKNPDTVSFINTPYLIPNPFEEYWKMRGLIK